MPARRMQFRHDLSGPSSGQSVWVNIREPRGKWTPLPQVSAHSWKVLHHHGKALARKARCSSWKARSTEMLLSNTAFKSPGQIASSSMNIGGRAIFGRSPQLRLPWFWCQEGRVFKQQLCRLCTECGIRPNLKGQKRKPTTAVIMTASKETRRTCPKLLGWSARSPCRP